MYFADRILSCFAPVKKRFLVAFDYVPPTSVIIQDGLRKDVEIRVATPHFSRMLLRDPCGLQFRYHSEASSIKRCEGAPPS